LLCFEGSDGARGTRRQQCGSRRSAPRMECRLWQSEMLDAVVDCDVGRVAILQGPVSVQYSTIPNQPVKEVLDSIHEGYIAKLKSKATTAAIPFVEYLGDFPEDARAADRVSKEQLPSMAAKSNYAMNISTATVTDRASLHPRILLQLPSETSLSSLEATTVTLPPTSDSLPDTSSWTNWLIGEQPSWWTVGVVELRKSG
jgi:hypothetical protein